MTETCDARLQLPVPSTINLVATLGALRKSGRDPSTALRPDGFWLAARLPPGPATVRLFRSDPNTVQAEAWGPGAAELLLRVPGLVGLLDDVRDFQPTLPLLRRLHAQAAGFRFARTGLMLRAAVATILGQKVTTVEASRAWGLLLTQVGEAAPGPLPLRLMPERRLLVRLPGHVWTRFGVHRAQAATISRVVALGPTLDAMLDLTPAGMVERLQKVRGIGPWTANAVARDAAGWADAVPEGDYHVKNTIAWALAGKARGSDVDMLALLEPHRPHRGRVVRLIESAGIHAPRFGPKSDVRPLPGSDWTTR